MLKNTNTQFIIITKNGIPKFFPNQEEKFVVQFEKREKLDLLQGPLRNVKKKAANLLSKVAFSMEKIMNQDVT